MTYWGTMMTAFDGVIVLSSWVEIAVLMMGFAGGASAGAFRALRGIRLLRVFKLFKKMKTFRILVRSIVQTIKSMSYFSVLLFLLMMVFTLMGSALFANQMRFDEEGAKIQDGEMYCPPYDVANNM